MMKFLQDKQLNQTVAQEKAGKAIQAFTLRRVMPQRDTRPSITETTSELQKPCKLTGAVPHSNKLSCSYPQLGPHWASLYRLQCGRHTERNFSY